ncbi:hypothetical protein BDZ45DRAFT_752088 [Acephala macrosclerotiorum]|nr:hypothetical protein BDZ45DRAFT_752088 [Acephala macrosclerotiorum]
MEFALTGAWLANGEWCRNLYPKRCETPGNDCHAENDEHRPQAPWYDYVLRDFSTRLRKARVWLDIAIEFGDYAPGSRDDQFQATSKLPSSTPPHEHILDTLDIPGRFAACFGLRKKFLQEFWNIFNGDMNSRIVTAASSTSSTSRSTTSSSSISQEHASSGVSRKRTSKDKEKRSSMDKRDQRLKRPKTVSTIPANPQNPNFACPYRKHNPTKYGLENFRACALSPWNSISRVKEHLYRSHSAPPYCNRCFLQFGSEADLLSHLRNPSPCCNNILGEPPEGITKEVEKRLKTRKKAYPGQTDEERWKEIYLLLFPGDIVPSPYFEPVRDAAAQAVPDSVLSDYDAHIQREVPRLFLSAVEDRSPVEFNQLDVEGIFRSVLDRASSEFRSRLATNSQTRDTLSGISSMQTDSSSNTYSDCFHLSDPNICHSPSDVYEAASTQENILVPDLDHTWMDNIEWNFHGEQDLQTGLPSDAQVGTDAYAFHPELEGCELCTEAGQNQEYYPIFSELSRPI